MGAEEIGSRETTDPGAHHHEIVALTGFERRAGRLPEGSVAQRVRDRIRALLAPAHPGERRRVHAASWRTLARYLSGVQPLEPPAGHDRPGAECSPIQKVSPADRAIHSQLAIARSVRPIALVIMCHQENSPVLETGPHPDEAASVMLDAWP